MKTNQPTLKTSLKAYLYLTPLLIGLTVFTWYPMVQSFLMSFYTKYNWLTNQVRQVGWANFEFLWHDPDFYLAFKNTIALVLVVVPIAVVVSIGFAVLLNQNRWCRRFFQTIYFLPFVTSTVAISLVWDWLFHSDYGLLNNLLNAVGLAPIAWLTNPKTAWVALTSLLIWKTIGFNVMLLLVGINNIDPRLQQVAGLDGANRWQRFWWVTLPLLRPTIGLVCVMNVIRGFKTFDEIFVLFNGQSGPGQSGLTLVYYLYQKFYVEYQYGVAAAVGVVLFGLLFLLTWLQLGLSKRRPIK